MVDKAMIIRNVMETNGIKLSGVTIDATRDMTWA